MANVLVVDDYPDFCQVVTRLLRAEGHAAVGVVDGAAAIDFVRRSPPDLVLLDMAMPGLNGLDVLAAIRDDPDLARTAVLIYSASVDPDARSAAMRLGAQDYLVKSLTPFDELSETVRRYVPQAEAHA
ncbi:MAG TPA: response regulator [Humisphaera sp.]